MAEPSPALVQRAQAGDRDALTALVQSQQTYVYSIAMSLMHNPADAADMTQEAFVRLLRSLGTYRAETKFTTWLYRLVTNICLDGLRRRGRPVDSLDGPARRLAMMRRHLANGSPTATVGRSRKKRFSCANRQTKCARRWQPCHLHSAWP
jgi:DNA-directed RNA polymerase specialized sigma24 family protein